MKKIYLKPETMTMKISSSMLLSGSDPQTGADPDATPVDPGLVESRQGRGFWDDEEDY